MAIFGRESEADQQRAQHVTGWIRARPGGAIIAFALGVLSVLDCWTLVIGVAAGVAAIIVGLRTLRGEANEPDAPGRKLCIAAMVLGVIGIVLSGVMMTVVYPALSASNGGG